MADPDQLGLAEFVAHLIRETFDAVITSQSEQEERIVELQRALTLSVEEYADHYITDEDADAQLAALFPNTVIEVGTAYTAGRKPPATESPSFQEVLGITIGPRDVTTSQRGSTRGEKRLNARGLQRIRMAVNLQLAEAQLPLLHEMVNRGMPRILVDSGTINAKVTLQIEENTAPAPASTAKKVRGIALLSASALNLQRKALPYKMLVRNADERSPQATQVKANVYGSIEITFKTVT